MVQGNCQYQDNKSAGGEIIIATVEDFPPVIKPNCPECGSGDISSYGCRWRCAECGYQFLKNRRTQKQKILNKPNCVECGSSEIVSRGTEWECKTCGRRFKKVTRS